VTGQAGEVGRPLGRLAATALSAADVARTLALLLARPVRRTPERVAREYDRGTWRRMLEERPWTRYRTPGDFVRTDDTRPRTALVDGRLVRITTAGYYGVRARTVQRLIAEAANGDAQIVEIGCGWGVNILTLSEDPRWRSLVGLDVSPAGIEAARQAAAHFGLDRVRFEAIDLRRAEHPGFIHLRGRTVFSYYCLEQLKHDMATVLENLRQAGPRRVIHVETTAELWRPRRLRELASLLYTRRMDYQDNLLTHLRRAHTLGRVRLLRVERLGHSPTLRCEPSLVVWEPVLSESPSDAVRP
jgi:methyltransferase family protein